MYGTLLDLVRDVNSETSSGNSDESSRIGVERHGAIRLGTAKELYTMRRLFKVMGMEPVGYYDLSIAQVPVHATAFRPVREAALQKNPFRVFTSLLRMELIGDAVLREEASAILKKRDIFTGELKALLDANEKRGGLDETQSSVFVQQALETFKWHHHATVSKQTYERLQGAHRLIADVVSFKGPHINHLTPRTLDIERVQRLMPERGIVAKETIEGPPTRKVPILLRQTSFKALEERIHFVGGADKGDASGTHTARFGEIEQRGAALTRKGRALYDALLQKARDDKSGASYEDVLLKVFRSFPDDLATLHAQKLAYFRYQLSDPKRKIKLQDLDDCIKAGTVTISPIIYEDFLPVSAAG